MRFHVRARDGASYLKLGRETREAADLAAIVLTERGYLDVEVVDLEKSRAAPLQRLARTRERCDFTTNYLAAPK